MSLRGMSAGQRKVAAFYALLFLIHVSSSVFVARKAEFPTNIDERAHYSYVVEMSERPALLPAYEGMRLWDLEAGDWSDERNYLNHPSPYYLFLAAFPRDVATLRVVNVVISALAVGLLCIFGLRHLGDPLQHILFASAVTLCPKAQALGGLINNDNLALLAGAVVLWGLAQPRSSGSALWIGLGFALGALSKLTAGLLLGLVAALAHVRDVASLRPRYLVVLSVFAALAVAPYLANLVEYGAPLYVNVDYHVVPEARRLALEAPDFAVRFLTLVATTWAAFEPGMLFETATFLALLGLALISRNRLSIYALAAAAAVLAIHLVFQYRLHLETGHLGGANFRYYLPVWPFLALGAATALDRLPPRLRGPTAFGLMLLLLNASVPVANQWHGMN